MRNRTHAVVAAAVLLLALAPAAHAQSSGNFAGTVNNTQCTIGSGGGLLSPSPTPRTFTLGAATITTPTSSKVDLLIGLSAVTGLFTNTMTNAGIANPKIRVGVTVTGTAGQVEPMGMITFDERYQQLTTTTGTPLLCVANGGGSTQCNVNLLLSTLSAKHFNFFVKGVGGGTHSVVVQWDLLCRQSNGSDGPCPVDNTADACVGPATLTVQQVRSF